MKAAITRRSVLRTGLVAAGGAAVAAVLPGLHLFAGMARPAAGLTHSAFAAEVGTSFRVALDGGRTAELRLVRARALTPPDHLGQPPATGEGFALDFAGGAGTQLRGATYSVSHPRFGRFDLFLSPVGPPGASARYEAVFNRMWS